MEITQLLKQNNIKIDETLPLKGAFLYLIFSKMRICSFLGLSSLFIYVNVKVENEGGNIMLKKIGIAFLMLFGFIFVSGCVNQEDFSNIPSLTTFEMKELVNSTESLHVVRKAQEIYFVIEIKQPTNHTFAIDSVVINNQVYRVGDKETPSSAESRVVFVSEDQTKLYVPYTIGTHFSGTTTFELNRISYLEDSFIKDAGIPRKSNTKLTITIKDRGITAVSGDVVGTISESKNHIYFNYLENVDNAKISRMQVSTLLQTYSPYKEINSETVAQIPSNVEFGDQLFIDITLHYAGLNQVEESVTLKLLNLSVLNQSKLVITEDSQLVYYVGDTYSSTNTVAKFIDNNENEYTVHPDLVTHSMSNETFLSPQRVYANVESFGKRGYFSLFVYAQKDMESVVNTLRVGVDALPRFEMPGRSPESQLNKLMFGYETVSITSDGRWVLNPIVVTNHNTLLENATTEAVRTIENDIDVYDKTYTIHINQNLKYSNGSSIKAVDYVFSFLLLNSKQFGYHLDHQAILGYDGYRNQQTTSADIYFSGIKLMDEYSFSITVDGRFLPHFDLLSYLRIIPLPFESFAGAGFHPATDIISDSNGTKMTAIGYSRINTLKSNSTNANVLSLIASGPYMVTQREQESITLEKNPYFIGNFEGNIPSIQTIVYSKHYIRSVHGVISNDLDITSFIDSAERALLAKTTGAHSISYYHNNHTMFAMNCDFGPTSNVKIRLAMAYLLERQGYIDHVFDGNATYASSAYSPSQWMYQQSVDELIESLTLYQVDIDQANALLSETEWIYESDGVTLFDPAKAALLNEDDNRVNTYFRHNANQEVLQINVAIGVSSSIMDVFHEYFGIHFGKAGIKTVSIPNEFNILLDEYYYSYLRKPSLDNPVDQRIFHATIITTIVGLNNKYYQQFHSKWYETNGNPMQTIDSIENPAVPLEDGELTLDEIIDQMMAVHPEELEEYRELWVQFNLRWNKIIPSIPLYAYENTFAYNIRVSGIQATGFWTWEDAICDMSITN